MPYTRQQLIEAFRADNPDAKDIPDNKIFAAIAVEDPELAKGISELGTTAIPGTMDQIRQILSFYGSEKPETVAQKATRFAGTVLNTAPQAATGFNQPVQIPGQPGLSQFVTGMQGAMQGAIPSPLTTAASGTQLILGSPAGQIGESLANAGQGVTNFFKRPALSATDVNRWMGVSGTETAGGFNPGAQILQDKLLGATKKITLDNVNAALSAANQEFHSTLNAPRELLDRIENLKIASRRLTQSIGSDVAGEAGATGAAMPKAPFTPAQQTAAKIGLGVAGTSYPGYRIFRHLFGF